MNDSIQLSGLSRQLVQANLLDEKTAVQAQAQAQRNKLSLVTHLVQNKLVSGLALAELSAEQFGIAYCDLNSLDKESFPRDAISEKLVRQHRVIPLWRRGNKLFVGISDPANHQAVNDVQFSTGLTTEAILVEDDMAWPSTSCSKALPTVSQASTMLTSRDWISAARTSPPKRMPAQKRTTRL